MTYPVVFYREDNGAISGYVPGLPIYVAADTRRQAERAMKDLIAEFVAHHTKDGAAPPSTTAEIRVARIEVRQRIPSRVSIVSAAALIGRSTSKAKTAAARANGAKGGRPRKSARA